jgi:hypothetical protein
MSTLTFALLVALGTLALIAATVAFAPMRSRLKHRRSADAKPDPTPPQKETKQP